MISKIKISLAWKWVIASLVIECFMLSLMVVKNVNQLEDNLSSQTYIRLNEQKILLQSALAAPLVQMDYATVNAILKETKAISNIDYLIVVDKRNNCIASIDWDNCKVLPITETNPFDEAALAELILSAILLIAISKWIIKNLVQLTQMANAIAYGDYSKRIELDDSKETSELQTSFNIMANNIQKNIENLEISYKEQKLLSDKLQSQLLKNKEQTQLIKQQSRMAALGEMLANISHQWRQPLNAITVHLSSLKLKNELHMIKESDINETVDSVINYANYLSNTIDDFRNFLSNDSVKKDFSIQKSFEKAKNITSINLTNQQITLDILPCEELIFNGIKNELTQVFINILNNAKDVLMEQNLKHKVIKVAFYKKDSYIYITIQDNGGGVKEEIIDKIFDPYFTTKHQTQGTGIGLYMSSKIIHEHFNGEIFVQNEEIIYENQAYKGAKFYIVLPDLSIQH